MALADKGLNVQDLFALNDITACQHSNIFAKRIVHVRETSFSWQKHSHQMLTKAACDEAHWYMTLGVNTLDKTNMKIVNKH